MTTEHTDRQALADLWQRMDATPVMSATRPWPRVLWTWITEELFAKPFEPVEPISQDEPIRRRIRIYKRGTRLARRLHRLNQAEAKETLAVTAMLLGFRTRTR